MGVSGEVGVCQRCHGTMPRVRTAQSLFRGVPSGVHAAALALTAVAGTAPSEVIDLLTPSPMPPPAAGVGPPSGEPRQWDSDAIDSAAGELRAARRLGILPAR